MEEKYNHTNMRFYATNDDLECVAILYNTNRVVCNESYEEIHQNFQTHFSEQTPQEFGKNYDKKGFKVLVSTRNKNTKEMCKNKTFMSNDFDNI